MIGDLQRQCSDGTGMMMTLPSIEEPKDDLFGRCNELALLADQFAYHAADVDESL